MFRRVFVISNFIKLDNFDELYKVLNKIEIDFLLKIWYNMCMTINSIIKSKPYILWHVKEKEKVSPDLALESIFNYGDFSDVKKAIKILGVKRAEQIFKKGSRKKRSNYRPEIKHYFDLYFKKYV